MDGQIPSTGAPCPTMLTRALGNSDSGTGTVDDLDPNGSETIFPMGPTGTRSWRTKRLLFPLPLPLEELDGTGVGIGSFSWGECLTAGFSAMNVGNGTSSGGVGV